jgi:signal transduction histidine kinase
MSELSKNTLASELFGSIISFNNKNEIAFAGELLLKVLSLSGIDIGKIVTDNFKSEDGRSLLSTINKVRDTRKCYTFKFKKIDDEFILFPPNMGDKENVFLSIKKAIDHSNKLERDLKERVKELECLYNVSQEIHRANYVYETFQRCTEHIRNGFQYPEITSVIIEYNGVKYINSGGSEKRVKSLLSDENILKNAERRGEIRVIYHKKKPFLREEINLLREISYKFTRAIEREEKTKVLEKQKKVLISRNKILLKLTEECRRGREQLQTFFRAITDKILVIDTDYNIILSNSDDIVVSGKCYNQLFKYDKVCDNCPAIETFKNSDLSSIDKEYSNEFLRLRTYPIYNNDGNVDRVLEVCRNITKEKKMEFQLLESHKLASLGRLVAGVAHEINNPNTFILGNTKIIKEAFGDILPIVDREYEKNQNLKIARLNYELFKDNISTLIDDTYNGAVKIKKIVEELRNYAKKEDDILSDTVNINNVIENTLRLVKKQIKENVKIIMKLKEGIPTFNGNISKLEQVAINLLLNASHAIGNNDGVIYISTNYNPSSKSVFLSVEDNGKGMDEDTLKNIFDPFFTTKRNEGGIGLGLSISYRIIKEHKGEIEVDSIPGKGTNFVITIPAA